MNKLNMHVLNKIKPLNVLSSAENAPSLPENLVNTKPHSSAHLGNFRLSFLHFFSIGFP